MKSGKLKFEPYFISMDKDKLDLKFIHTYLSEESYWAAGRSMQTVKTSVQHSICFGIYSQDDQQVGFARVVTDYATIVWICDLFISEEHRGRGLGKHLVKTIMDYPDYKKVRRYLLATRDAHSLYSQYGGFEALQNPDHWMTRFIGEL